MTLISVLIVLALEYYFCWGAEYRQFNWFLALQQKLDDLFSDQDFFQGWGGVAMILLLPVVLLWLFISAFSGPVYWLLLFVTSVAVLFLSIGPNPLLRSFESFFNAMERGDQEAGYLALQQESQSDNLPESDDLIRNATRAILVESQIRYFGVLIWFVFFGPFGALFYRLAHQYNSDCQKNAREDHLTLMPVLLHWLDWIPARITSFLFLLTGDFVNGFYRVKDYFVDLSANNGQIISETGIAALGIDLGMKSEGLQENYDSLSLIKRTTIIYLVVVAVLSPLAIW